MLVPRIGSFFFRRMTTSEGTEFSIAYVTTPTEEVAKRLAQGLVESKMAACVNIVPSVTSIYKWKGEIQNDQEVLMIIKTKTTRVPDITTYIRKNHPYEVCEVITTQITGGNEPYLEWLRTSVEEVS